MNTKFETASAVRWSSTSQFSRQLAQFVTMVVLARFLPPAEIGLMTMALVVTSFISLFKDLGTSSAVVQQKEVSSDLASTLFWTNVAFGVLAMGSLGLLSGVASDFFHEPRLRGVLWALSLTFSLSGPGIVQQALFQRSLEFRILSVVEISSTVVGCIAAIICAVNGGGVWSLVVQSILTTMLSTALLWYWSPWKPRLHYRWREFRLVSRYSFNLAGFNIFNYFVRSADSFFIGRFLGAEQLGYYSLAYRIMLYPVQNISGIVSRVAFPLFSRVQDDDALLRRMYLKITSGISLITFPLMIGVWVLADPLVHTVFGERWAPVIPLILLLAPVGLAQSIEATVGPIYQAKGRTDWLLGWGVVTGLIVVGAFYFGLRWGIVGVAMAYLVTDAVLLYPNFAIPFRLFKLPVRALPHHLAKTLAVSCAMGLLLWMAVFILPSSIWNWATLVAFMAGGTVIYGLLTQVIQPQQVADLLYVVGRDRNARTLGTFR